MLAEIMRQMIEEQRRQAREEAQKRLYEFRKNMWDAEKRAQSCKPCHRLRDELNRRQKGHKPLAVCLRGRQGSTQDR